MSRDLKKDQNYQKKKMINPSLYFDRRTEKRTWLTRTFSKMRPGAIRGNIFLLLITTTGCAFFYIPYYGKKSGIVLLSIMMIVAGALSFYSNYLLYYGFKATKAKSYDECMAKTLGPFSGILSNVLVFAHCWAAMISSWIFSYSFLDSVLQEILGPFSESNEKLYTYVFFGVSLFIIYASTIFGDIDKLKFVAAWGIIIILYILVVLFMKMPSYFDYYNQLNLFQIEGFIWTIFNFKSWGMCQYIFLNQYTIIPICNNIHNVTSRRLQKVIKRTTILLCFLYLAILFIGDFSQPSLSLVDELPELFILRPAIPDTNDTAVLIGKLFFVFSLFVAVMIKAQFFLLYFWQIVSNIKNLCSNKTKNLKCEVHVDKEIKEDGPNVLDKEFIPENSLINSEKNHSTITYRLQKRSEDFIHIREHKFSTPGKNVEQDSTSLENKDDKSEDINEEKIKDTDSQISEDDHLKKDNNKKVKYSICSYIQNFFIFLVVTIINIILKDSLSTVLSVIGNFVGIFELTIFPFCMILIINKRVPIISKNSVIFIYAIIIFFTAFGFLSFVMSFFVHDKVH